MQEPDESRWPNHHLSRFVNAGGMRWHVQQTGSGPLLLLIHGTGASMHSWRDLIPILARDFTVLAADLPGHAFTDSVSSADSSIDGMSILLGRLLTELQYHPEYCVGHSAGAVILCRMALAGLIAPRVIVSINGAFMALRGIAGLLLSLSAKMMASNSLIPRLLARRAADPSKVARVLAGTGSRVDSAGVELYARLVSRPRHMMGTLRMMSNWNLPAFERELPRLATPLVLMVAEGDRTVPPQQARTIGERLGCASIVSLPGLGHLAHEEAPQMVAAEIARICHSYAGSA